MAMGLAIAGFILAVITAAVLLSSAVAAHNETQRAIGATQTAIDAILRHLSGSADPETDETPAAAPSPAPPRQPSGSAAHSPTAAGAAAMVAKSSAE